MTAALPIMERVPMAAGQMLLALDRRLGSAYELVLVGDLARDDMKSAISLIQKRYLPRIVLAVRDSSSSDPTGSQSGHLNELFAGKESANGEPTLFVCQNFACQQPAIGIAAIEKAVAALK